MVANLIATFHGLILIPILIFSPLIFLIARRRYLWLEVSFIFASIATIINTILLDYCVLSEWEYFFRSKINPNAVYADGFVVMWMKRAGIYWTEEMTIWIGGLFIILGFLVLTYKKIKMVNI